MKDFLLSSDGDIVLQEDIELASEDIELVQSVYVILSIKLGEFSLEQEIGLNTENMLGKNYNEEYLKQDITWAILEQEKRIANITDIEVTQYNRELSITVRMVATTNEEIEVMIDAG